MSRLCTAAVVLALCAGSGCIIARGHGPHGEHTVIWAPGLGTRVLVNHDHECSIGCGHYWHDARWYDTSGHRHAVGCGHHWLGGRWVSYEEVRVAPVHHCHAGCGHYRHHDSVYYVRGHAHGPGCGHVFRAGYWFFPD